jgi:hypothetical protein
MFMSTPGWTRRKGPTWRKGLVLGAAALLALTAVAVGLETANASIQGNVYLSPTGDDANPGTQSAPVRTPQRAQQLVRTMNQNMTADVTVVLGDGFYRLTSPLSLTPADSGTNGHNVVWTADTGARPVFAGSAQITGWTRMSANSPIFVAQAPAGLKTRQLYVNGVRAPRAHGSRPNDLTGRNSSGYSGGGTTMAGWRNPSGARPQLEFVYTGGLGAWTEPRCPVASFSGDAVNMQQPCWSNSTTRACCFADGRAYNLVGRMSITEQPTSVENAFQFLSASTPGQWFLDQGDSKLYYVPRSGENMATADVEAPVLEKLVDGNGTPTSPIHHIVFSGIQFSYATWLGPSGPDGFSEIQANYQVTGPNGAARQGLCDVAPAGHEGDCPYAAWTQAPANVSLTFDQNVQFVNDAFVHLGAAGLGLGNGTQRSLVKGNIFTDTSGSGIQLGNVNMPTATGASQTLANTIADNHVFNLPAEYHGGIGIDVGYAASTSVVHNQVDHTPYTAISIGWGGWPDKEAQPPRPNFTHDNSISNNLIFNHMATLNDGGAIYTQGLTGTSLANGEHVAGNLIHDQTGKGHVVYTDNGCTFESIIGNGIYNTGAANAWGSTHHNYMPGATTTNDPTDVKNNFWMNGAANGTNNGVTISGNTAITSPSQIPAGIVDNAGLEPAFRSLLSWTQAPLPPVDGAPPGLVLSSLNVADTANAANWSLRTNLQVGDAINGDRAYTVSALPAAIVGAQWVRTANSSKTATVNPLVTFTINRTATVYVGVDSRSGRRPWMDATWVDTGTTLTTDENGTARTFQVFRRSFPTGQVALGPNAANTNMYTIAVV